MTRTLITTNFIAAAGELAVGLLASQTRSEEMARAAVRDVPAGQFFVDCWIGMKWGDQPGQLIRGWICERPAAKADQHSSAPSSPRAPREVEDVAAIGPDGIRR